MSAIKVSYGCSTIVQALCCYLRRIATNKWEILTNGGAGFFPFLSSALPWLLSSSRMEIEAELWDRGWLYALFGLWLIVASRNEVAGVSGGVLGASEGDVKAGDHLSSRSLS